MNDPKRRSDDDEHEILEAFDADKAVKDPGDKEEPVGGPAADADAPAPG
jgi:hypothetical protein